MNISRLLRVLALAATTGLAAFSTSAREYRCAVTDPAGDPTEASGIGFDGEPYQDMIRSSIARNATELVFTMEMAAPLPGAPALRVPNGVLLWMWGMNTDPSVPLGYPLARGNAGILDFWIHLAWNGSAFYAEVIDRRPTLVGGPTLVTAVPYTIDGATIRIVAPSSLFDDPAEFRWGSTTWIWAAHLGTSGGLAVDRAPDTRVTVCSAS